MQRAVPVFVCRIDLGGVIHDFAGECKVAERVNSRKTGVLADVKGDGCELGESSQFRPFHLLLESPCHLF